MAETRASKTTVKDIGDRQTSGLNALIPTCIDYDPRADLRRPMVMMCQG
jgi:hypothetical protein